MTKLKVANSRRNPPIKMRFLKRHHVAVIHYYRNHSIAKTAKHWHVGATTMDRFITSNNIPKHSAGRKNKDGSRIRITPINLNRNSVEYLNERKNEVINFYRYHSILATQKHFHVGCNTVEKFLTNHHINRHQPHTLNKPVKRSEYTPNYTRDIGTQLKQLVDGVVSENRHLKSANTKLKNDNKHYRVELKGFTRVKKIVDSVKNSEK